MASDRLGKVHAESRQAQFLFGCVLKCRKIPAVVAKRSCPDALGLFFCRPPLDEAGKK